MLFSHDADHQRFQQFSSAGTTTYLAGSGAMAERLDGSGSTTQWTNYLMAGGELVGMRVESSTETVYTRYFTKDHLGSVAVVTNEAGAVVERLSFDAWGKRRFPDGADDVTGSITSQTSRGFTGHEELDGVGLVHMNGRVYDPLLGRFGTADPMTENPHSTQGWNRYSYVGNSPLNFTDPSGYCFLGCFWQNIFSFIQTVVVPIIGNVLTAAATAALCTNPVGALVCMATVAALSSAFIAGVSAATGPLVSNAPGGYYGRLTATSVIGGLTPSPAAESSPTAP